jgi:hypothetical protein
MSKAVLHMQPKEICYAVQLTFANTKMSSAFSFTQIFARAHLQIAAYSKDLSARQCAMIASSFICSGSSAS